MWLEVPVSIIKRKYCNLHGWAPHLEYLMVTGVDYDTKEVTVDLVRECRRCFPLEELSEGKRILAKLRGFRLHKSMTAKTFLASKSKQEIV